MAFYRREHEHSTTDTARSAPPGAAGRRGGDSGDGSCLVPTVPTRRRDRFLRGLGVLERAHLGDSPGAGTGWEAIGRGHVRDRGRKDLAPLYNNVVHWGYGIAWAGLYGLVAGSLGRSRLLLGIPFGAFVWASGYAVLAPMKLYKPKLEYDRATLARDLSAHLAYGVGTAIAFEVLDRR